jgi:2-dehydropantoate 2-reductase
MKVTGIWGSRHFNRFNYPNLKSLIRDKPAFDLIIVSVKSFDTERAAQMISKFKNRQSVILLLQNGLGNIEIFERYFPKKDLLAGRVIFGVERKSGGIKITVSAEPTAIGETSSQKVTKRVRDIATRISDSGIPCVSHKDVRSLLWKKVVYNCALNPLASLIGCHYGYLGEQRFTRMMMEQVIDEVYQIAQRKKVCLDPHTAKGFTQLFYKKLLPRTYRHHPSMLQDLQRGSPTEIDALNGAISKLGVQLKIQTPANTLLTRLIKELECKRDSVRKS